MRPQLAWRTDQYHTGTGPKDNLQNVVRHFKNGSASDKQKDEMLKSILAEKHNVENHLSWILTRAIVVLAEACGLKYDGEECVKPRCCNTFDEVRKAMAVLPDTFHKYAIFHFIFSYFGTGLVPDLFRTNHQNACEAAIMKIYRITFVDYNESEGNKRHKTCIAKSYSKILNRLRSSFHRSVFPKWVVVGVEKNGWNEAKHYKREK